MQGPQSVEAQWNIGWVEIFHALSLKLLNYQKSRKDLIKIVYEAFAQTELKPPMEKPSTASDAKPGKLKDICPFTIFSAINRSLDNEQRDKLLYAFVDLLKADVPASAKNFKFSSPKETRRETIPLLPSINYAFFAPATQRKPSDIPKLWELFAQAIKYADGGGQNKDKFVDAYGKALSVKRAANTNLSIGLFTLRPHTFPSLDRSVCAYLYLLAVGSGMEDRLLNTFFGQEARDYDGATYLDVAEALKKEFSPQFISKEAFIYLSYEGYNFVQSHKL